MSLKIHFLPGGGGGGRWEWVWVFVRPHAGGDAAVEECGRGAGGRLASAGSPAEERSNFSMTWGQGAWGGKGLVEKTAGSTLLLAVSEG